MFKNKYLNYNIEHRPGTSDFRNLINRVKSEIIEPSTNSYQFYEFYFFNQTLG